MKIETQMLRISLILVIAASCGGADWLQFRGNDNTSVAEDTSLPTKFAEGKNVAWKVDLPGRGPANPIVVGDRVFVTCSSGAREDRLHVLALNASDGSTAWHRQLWATGHTQSHPMGAVANNTPASDGKSIFAFYSSNDLACFDLDGNLRWFRGLASDYPTMRNDVGMASSPLAVGEMVVVQCQNQGESFVAGIDTRTGLTRWRVDLEHDGCWSSPTVLRGADEEDDVVLIQDRTALVGLKPQTGEESFRFAASVHTIASVTTHGNRIYLPANGIFAFQYDPEKHDVTELWYEKRLRGGYSSPVAYKDTVLRAQSPAFLSCADAETGRILWKLRLEGAGAMHATPLVADGYAYVAGYDGSVFVVRLGEKGELVSTNFIEKGLLASPVAADGALYLRTATKLLKISSR